LSAEVFEAVFKDGRALVSSLEEANSLSQYGYGTLKEGLGSILDSCEALYLLADGRLKLVDDETGSEMIFPELLEKFHSRDAEVWTRYLIYRDLRGRGYVVRRGFGFNIDFRVFERGKYGIQAANYIVFGVCEGGPVSISRLAKVLRFVRSVKKELILAVVDGRGEIVYYSVSPLTFRRGEFAEGE